MEGYSSKRDAFGSIAPKKRYNIGFKKSSAKMHDPDAQFCNRLGCSGRIKYTNQNTKIGTSEKATFSNNTIGNSSMGSSSLMTRARSVFFDSKRKISSRSGLDPSESSQSGDSESQELLFSPSPNFKSHGSTNKTQEVVMIAKNVSSSSLSSVRPRKAFHHKSDSNDQITRSDSKSSGLKRLNICSNTSSSSSCRSKSSSSSNKNSKHGMRKSKCGSISDIVPPRCSSSESKSSRKSVLKKKNLEAFSLSRGGPQNGHLCSSTSGISISDSGHTNSASGDSKNSGSFRTRRLSYQQSGRNSSSLREPSLHTSHFSNSELQFRVGGPQFSEGESGSYRLSNSSNGNGSSVMPSNTGELGFTRLMDHERYNMDGITQVLLAIERFEQDERLTHEQVHALETNLFLSGPNLYDQHRDMRLDIDNMSYEELLSLEERMGTVSTGLSEEAVLKSIKKSIYEVGPPEVRAEGSGEDEDDSKCSICQEEYELGDETGKLIECQHGYHLTCINQWLRLKNWCPICKAAVAPQE